VDGVIIDVPLVLALGTIGQLSANIPIVSKVTRWEGSQSFLSITSTVRGRLPSIYWLLATPPCGTSLGRRIGWRRTAESPVGGPPWSPRLPWYQAVGKDIAHAQSYEPVATPALLVGTETSSTRLRAMVADTCTDVRAVVIERSGHYLAEEQPESVARNLHKSFPASR
jgi:pimeloyl-ACP methyl ester carboxylesterase